MVVLLPDAIKMLARPDKNLTVTDGRSSTKRFIVLSYFVDGELLELAGCLDDEHLALTV